MITWLAGAPCKVNALRTKDRTMTIRLKQVISRMIEGAIDSRVMAKSTWMATSTSFGWPMPSIPMLSVKGGNVPPVAVEAAAPVAPGA
jgi:hypothetical protein